MAAGTRELENSAALKAVRVSEAPFCVSVTKGRMFEVLLGAATRRLCCDAHAAGRRTMSGAGKRGRGVTQEF